MASLDSTMTTTTTTTTAIDVLKSLPVEKVKQRLHKALLRVASSTNEQELQRTLDLYRQLVVAPASQGSDPVDREMMKQFLDRQDDEDGSSALTHAACFGHASICYVLIQAGASVDIQDKRTCSLVVVAVGEEVHLVPLCAYSTTYLYATMVLRPT